MSHAHTSLITGASRGLGLALARALAAEGWTLILDARNADDLAAAVAGLDTPANVLPLQGDITDAEHVSALAEAARARGGLDLVVNNASTLGHAPLPPLLEYPLDEMHAVFRTNVVAPLAILQAIRPLLRPGAVIINITSDAAVEPYEGWGGYGASKAALEQLSAVLAAEEPDLHVYWVDPGDMRTRMHADAFPGEDISDRPLPEARVPGFLHLIHSRPQSGRYTAEALIAAQVGS